MFGIPLVPKERMVFIGQFLDCLVDHSYSPDKLLIADLKTLIIFDSFTFQITISGKGLHRST